MTTASTHSNRGHSLFAAEFMVPLLNYMTKDVNTFLSGSYHEKPFVISMLESIQKAFESDE